MQWGLINRPLCRPRELLRVAMLTWGRVHGRMKLSMRSAGVGSMFGGGAFTLLRCLGVSSGTSLQAQYSHGRLWC